MPFPTLSWLRRCLGALAALSLLLGLATRLPASACPRVSLAYYASWSESYYPSSAIPYAKLTHIAHAFMQENADGSLSIPAGYLDANLISSAHAAGVKVLVSVGGSSWSGAFPALANSPSARANFCAQIEAFCRSYGYDGVDIDWEFPDNATKSNDFVSLMQDLRNKFNASPAPAPGWQITAALSGDQYYAGFLQLGALKNSLTYFNVMTYDYHGPWTNHSGHNAGLFISSMEVPGHGQADQSDSINYFINNGAPASQVIMGLPFYGYQFPTANLYGSCSCAGTTALAYRDIAPLVGNGWTYNFDATAQSPYLTNGSNVITYDDPTSIGIKADWAINTRGVAGVFMWALDQDYLGPGNQPLLAAMSAKAFNCATPTFTVTPTRALSSTPTPTPVVASTWRINAGGPAYSDTLGRLWSADSLYSGGTPATTTQAVSGPDPALFQSERYGASFSYSFAVPPGAYQVTLRFAEIYYTAPGLRLFNVAINGAAALTQFDIVQAAGAAFTPVDKVFDGISPSGGLITLSFSSGSADLPKVSALQVIPEPMSTATATPTLTPSATATLTRTATVTLSSTVSATATATATAPAPTASTTAAASVSATATVPGPTASATAAASPAATVTATVPAATASATASVSATVSRVASPTATAAASTASVTAAASPTLTASATPTSRTSSATPSATASAMATRTATATSSVTPAATATRTPASPPTASVTPSPTARAMRGDGGLRILAQHAVPDPNPHSIAVLLGAPVTRVRVRIWSKALRQVAEAEAGSEGVGWCQVSLPAPILGALAPDAYYYTVEAWGGDVKALGLGPGRLVLLR